MQNNYMERTEELIQSHNYVILVYRILDDPVDKFIVMACLQMGYTQDDVARMLDISQVAVSKKLKEARRILKLKQDQVIL